MSNRLDDNVQLTETTYNDVFAVELNGNLYFQKYDFSIKYGDFGLKFGENGLVIIEYNGLVQEINNEDPDDMIIYKNQVYFHNRLFPENAQKIEQPAG